MDSETKDTLKKVAEYAAEEKKKIRNRLVTMVAGCTIFMLICSLLFARESKGYLNGIVPEQICGNIMAFAIGLAAAACVLYYLYLFGVLDKLIEWKRQLKSKKKDRIVHE
jgi:hypothetical protein